MMPLARRLRQAGFHTLIFNYPSLRYAPADNARRLATRITIGAAATVHYVAHSLGGLVVRHLLADHGTTLPPGRTVTLGTPHQGSSAASNLCHIGLRFGLGRSIDRGLLGNVPPWPAARELGSLAGDSTVGAGRLFGNLPKPNDGTVAVAETYCEGMTDHVCLPVNHTQMLFSAEVAAQVIAFLQTGRFRHPDSGREKC